MMLNPIPACHCEAEIKQVTNTQYQREAGENHKSCVLEDFKYCNNIK